MIRRMLCLFLVLLPVLAALGAEEEEAETRALTVQVPDADSFEISHPAAWTAQVIQPSPELPPTVRLSAPATQKVSLQITFMVPPNPPTTQEEVDRLVHTAARRYVEGSVERSIEVVKLDHPDGLGAYARLTDASLVDEEVTPSQYKVVGTGVIVCDRVLMAFTLLADDFEAGGFGRGLELLEKGLRREGAKAADGDEAGQRSGSES